MAVIHLLDEFIVASVRPLVGEREIEVSTQVVLPVTEGLHRVHVVADPVFVDRNAFPLHKHGMPAALHIVPQPFHHHSQVGVLRGQDAWDCQLDIVVGAVVAPFQVLGRQGMLEGNDSPFVDRLGYRTPGVQRKGVDALRFPLPGTRDKQQARQQAGNR